MKNVSKVQLWTRKMGQWLSPSSRQRLVPYLASGPRVLAEKKISVYSTGILFYTNKIKSMLKEKRFDIISNNERATT